MADRTSEKVEAEAIRLYAVHKSIKKVARILGISQNTVHKILRRNGVEVAKPAPRIPADVEAEAVRLYAVHKSTYKVARILGISQGAMRKILRRNGVEVENPRARKGADVEAEAIRLYAVHKSATKVARILGISPNAVLSILRRNGVEVEKPTPRTPADVEAEAVRLYAVHKSANKVARILGISTNAVLSILRRNGVEVEKPAWHPEVVREFLGDLIAQLDHLTPAELYAIVARRVGIPGAMRGLGAGGLVDAIRGIGAIDDEAARAEALDRLIGVEPPDDDEDDEGDAIGATPASPGVASGGKRSAKANDAGDVTLRNLDPIRAIDAMAERGMITDRETIDFLVANRVERVWQAASAGDAGVVRALRRARDLGPYGAAIRRTFLEDYDATRALMKTPPPGYRFRVEGHRARPNLMQWRTAHLVATESRVGNWSAAGAGKTLSAVLASRVVDSRLTLIVANNSTIGGWSDTILSAFPDSDVIVKERGEFAIDRSRHTYLVFNYESFQLRESAEMIGRLVERHAIDFVVLDEVQMAKRRDRGVASKRCRVLGRLLEAAGEENPGLKVLGMSATPVVNNLYEATMLLSMITGRDYSDRKTDAAFGNALRIHVDFMRSGVRYRPEYRQDIVTRTPVISGDRRVGAVRRSMDDDGDGAILKVEQALLDLKMGTIVGACRAGKRRRSKTLVYTHYVDGMVGPLRDALGAAGLRVGVFTGEEKDGLDAFLKGNADVLIGSSAVGTGVDGLQFVCDRIIFASLPWTGAAYEQAIGRLYRQHSRFDRVEVVVPQVVLGARGREWSWDRMRLDRVLYKGTLCHAVLDGVIPEGELVKEAELKRQAAESLREWLAAAGDPAEGPHRPRKDAGAPGRIAQPPRG